MQRISDIMRREITTICAEENIQHAARLLHELKVESIPVVEGGKLVGIITDRDITVRVTSAAELPENTRVKDVMTRDLLWCIEDQSIAEVAEQMRDSHVDFIPVVAADSMRMIGVVSLSYPANNAPLKMAAFAEPQCSQTPP